MITAKKLPHTRPITHYPRSASASDSDTIIGFILDAAIGALQFVIDIKAL